MVVGAQHSGLHLGVEEGRELLLEPDGDDTCNVVVSASLATVSKVPQTPKTAASA